MTNAGLFTKDGAAIPLQGVEVTGEVLGAHARVKVRQRYRNEEPQPVEAVYTFPLPSESTLTGFAMSCNGRRLAGVVKEREQAFRDYDDAVWSGHGAALLDQERKNVFTVSVGNLLPGEETIIEIEYLERVQADEGALRWSIPTLVAPRYIPGAPKGDRTAGGWAEPTDRVPDADRITPPIGQVDYGLQLDLTFDLGHPVAVECPSHAVTVHTDGTRTRVAFAQREVALDRDVVVTARGVSDAPLATLMAHKPAQGPGYFALTVVPDLMGGEAKQARQDVVFVIDTSGSMEGASLPEAQAALRLCLRHLREGDRFNIIAFNTAWNGFAKSMVPFTQRTLEDADRWVAALRADGGTELLQPMLAAMNLAPDGVVVLLTDGQVGNEAEILTQVLAARKAPRPSPPPDGARKGEKARIYSFGIGTNVSDVLLRDLGKRTGGAVEFIHPGERIDEKVVAQFARAIAPRVTNLSVEWSGVEVAELAPSELPPLVDGEPWALFGQLSSGVHGRAVLRGDLDGKRFHLEIPLDLAERSDKPAIGQLWASERIRDLSQAELSGRRANRMKERIVELAIAHGISSPHTSFVVVEERQGDRRASGQPETRTVPVNTPAGWDMFKAQDQAARPRVSAGMTMNKTMSFSAGVMAPPSPPAAAPAQSAAPRRPGRSSPPMAKKMAPASASRGILGRAKDLVTSAFGGGDEGESGAVDEVLACEEAAPAEKMDAAYDAPTAAEPGSAVVELLGRQLANGLWDDGSGGDDEARQLRATARALLELLREGITTTHALHGAQVKKAVGALIALAVKVAPRDPAAAELALGTAWLLASGRRTRKEIESAIDGSPPLASLKPRLANEQALRAHIATLS